MRQRIGHLYHRPHPRQATEGWDSIPRGWIAPDGEFFKTRYHWSMIAGHLGKKSGLDSPEIGERAAHEAYSQGWISIGHGGALNAVGHDRIWRSGNHPAVATLRKLVSNLPHSILRIEKQVGKIDSETGRHEDFDVKEYDLEIFIKRGALRKA